MDLLSCPWLKNLEACSRKLVGRFLAIIARLWTLLGWPDFLVSTEDLQSPNLISLKDCARVGETVCLGLEESATRQFPCQNAP